VTDVTLTNVSPDKIQNFGIGVSYQTGLVPLASNRANRQLFFMDISRQCDSVCTSTATTCTISPTGNQFSSSGVELGSSYHVSKTELKFDFSQVTLMQAYRLCVLLDKTASYRSFIDLSNVRVFPVAPDAQFRVGNGAALYKDNYQINFVGSAGTTPRRTDFLYFRHSGAKCLEKLKYPATGQTPPAIADKNTTNTFVFLNPTTAMAINFSRINLTSTPLRLCVLTPTATLDYSSKKLFMSTVVVSTKVCRPTSTCEVDIRVTHPEGFFAKKSAFDQPVRIWFQRARCFENTQVPSSSESSHSGIASFQSSGIQRLSFTKTASSIQVPLQLCVVNNQNVVASFPTVQLYVLNIQLSQVALSPTVVFTKYVAPTKTTPVRITADVQSVPLNSLTWFQRSSQSCSKPTTATENHTSINTTTAVLTGQNILYDFSSVSTQPKTMLAFRLCFETGGQIIDASNVEVLVVEYTVAPLFFTATPQKLEQFQIWPGDQVQIKKYVFCRQDVPCPSITQYGALGSSNSNCSQQIFYGASVNIELWNVKDEGKLMRLCGIRDNVPSPDNIVDLSPVGIYRGALSLQPQVVDKTQANSAVQITWTNVLAPPVNSTQVSKVWFQARETVCSTSRQTDSSVSSNIVEVKKGTFAGNYQFSKMTSSVVKLCASVGGVVKEFSGVHLYLMTFDLGTTSVKPARQNFTVTYNSISDFGTVSVRMSSDVTCKSQSSTTTTSLVESMSGSIHSFDFSQGTPSSQKWILCLTGNATNNVSYPIPFASVYLVDIGDLGAAFVSNSPNQMLKLISSVSILANDTVWFSGTGCQSNQGRSSSVVFVGSDTYPFDFSSVSPSLNTMLSMCVSRNPVFEYSGSAVQVMPSFSFGGPFIEGQRAFNLSGMSAFLGSSQVSFVVNTSSCIGASFVKASTSSYDFPTQGTYRLCVKRTDGKIISLSDLRVGIQKCADICSTSRSSGVCTQAGKCQKCNARFAGDLCQNCVAGYTGANCDVCDMKNNYHCKGNSSASGFCSASSTCDLCSCNGHYDRQAKDRCPLNKCVCNLGYTGGACESCSPGYYKSASNTTTTFTCTNCANKCNKRALSCSSSRCQCSGNFDDASNCRVCKAGYQQMNSTSACFKTVAPTLSPTVAPSGTPTVAPSTAPTVAGYQCLKLNNSNNQCSAWANNGYCTSASYATYMKGNCQQACCYAQITKAPTVAPTVSLDNCTAVTDKGTSCPAWASAGYCSNSYKTYMSTNCQASCCKQGNIDRQLSVCDGYTCDKSSSCTSWALAKYCSDKSYATFMGTDCAQSCCRTKLCDKSGSDKSSQCSSWAASGYCEQSNFKSYMAGNCAYSCCVASAYSVAAVNQNTQCDTWAAGGYCSGSSISYMKQSCSRACCCTPLKDLSAQCQGWQNYCDKKSSFWGYMQKNCPATCCNKGVL
jgi:hypothetical protein